MKKILLPILVLLAGAAVGGAGAYGTTVVIGVRDPGAMKTVFVPTGSILTPLVDPDGRLSGYVSIEAGLEVPEKHAEQIESRLPLLLNAINMKTFRTPIASGKDGLIPNLEGFRRVVHQAAAETFGKDVVVRAVVTKASPI